MYDFVGQVFDYDVTLDLQQMKFLRFQADVWCLYWVKLTGRIFRKLPRPNIEKKESCALHVPYGCRVRNNRTRAV